MGSDKQGRWRFAFFAIGAYPWWASLIVVVDGIVIWGLTVRWEA